MEQAKRHFIQLKNAYTVLGEHRYTTVAGTLVFFLIMSLVPLLFFVTLLIGGTGISAEDLFELELFDWAKDLLTYLARHAEQASAGVNVVFLATTLWSGTGFFYHLKRSGEIIYGAKSKKGWKVRVNSFLFAFAVLLYATFSGALLFGADFMTRSLPVWASRAAVYTLALALAFFLAWLLHGYACPYRASPSETVAGSLFTAAAWLVASIAFAVYLNFTNRERLYGALSAVIVFLLFLYWIMICFTAGIVINCRRMGVQQNFHAGKMRKIP